MPGMTPNFGIRYPCAGDTIDPQVFQDFADDVEAALAAVEAVSDAAVSRPSGAVRTAVTGTSVAVGGALTLMAYTATDYVDGVTAIANGIQVGPGLWMVTAEFSGITTVASVTSWSGQVRNNPTVLYRRKLGSSVADTTPGFINLSGIAHCTAATNDIQGQWAWTGAGGPMFVFSRLSVHKVCDL